MMEKQELLTETSEKATTVTIKEISQTGIKLQYNAQGMVKGKYNGGHLQTVDVVQKIDGTFEYEARGIDSTTDGELIIMTGKGTGRQTSPTTTSFQGELSFMTQSNKFAWLNKAKGRVEGSTNQQTNEASFKVYTMG